MLKPDRLRYWLRSVALRDADETLADLRLRLLKITGMMANSIAMGAPTGSLGQDVHLPRASLYALLEFIAAELPDGAIILIGCLKRGNGADVATLWTFERCGPSLDGGTSFISELKCQTRRIEAQD